MAARPHPIFIMRPPSTRNSRRRPLLSAAGALLLLGLAVPPVQGGASSSLSQIFVASSSDEAPVPYDPADLIRELTARGYENVAAAAMSEESTLLVTFEYRLARSAAVGICGALRQIDAQSDAFERVVIILQHQDVDMVAVSFAREESDSDSCGGYVFQESSYDLDSYATELTAARSEGALGRPVDFIIHPQYRALFGFYRDPFQLQLSVAPEVNLRLWRGMQLGGQVILPLYNELAEEGSHVRPGLLTLSQVFRLPGPAFVSMTAGTFTNRRYGVDVRARVYFREGTLSLGLDAGRTNGVFYPNGSVFFEDDPRTTLIAQAGIFVAPYQLSARISGGRFLHGDNGVRFEVIRQFRGTDVGLFASATSNGSNAGFHLVIPIFRGVFLGGPAFRVRPTENLAWEYLYLSEGDVAVSYDTGGRFDESLRRHHPRFLKSLLSTHSP